MELALVLLEAEHLRAQDLHLFGRGSAAAGAEGRQYYRKEGRQAEPEVPAEKAEL